MNQLRHYIKHAYILLITATEREAAKRFARLCDFLVSSSSLSDEEDDEPQQSSSRLDCDTTLLLK